MSAVRASPAARVTRTTVGTGTLEFDAASGVYTEVQPGSYIFMDADYGGDLDAITRLLVGHNPLKGWSHYSEELTAEMKAFQPTMIPM